MQQQQQQLPPQLQQLLLLQRQQQRQQQLQQQQQHRLRQRHQLPTNGIVWLDFLNIAGMRRSSLHVATTSRLATLAMKLLIEMASTTTGQGC